MGLGVLDSDESNQSLLIGNAIASMVQQPSSALSMIPSENSNESSHIQESISPETFIESESNSQCTQFDVNISSNDANSLPNLQRELNNEQSYHGYQDFTPANLVPCNRTNFTGAIVDLQENASSTIKMVQIPSSAGKNDQIVQQPEGRAIRSTSMRQFNAQKTDSDANCKHKGRSPLAAITNSTTFNATDLDSQLKAVNNEDSFFMFQKRDPRNYTGPDNFAKLSDEVLLSIFKWLPKKALIRCSMVNQRFHRVTQDESLWTRLDLAGKTIQAQALGRILQRGVIILRLAQTKVFRFQMCGFLFGIN